MPSPFSQTTRSLDADRGRATATILTISLVLLLALVGWLLLARVPVYETTETARLEVVDAVRPVAAATGGRVVAKSLAIGRWVEADEVLVELAAEVELAAVAEAEARLTDLRSRRGATLAELTAQERALQAHAAAATVAVGEARAQTDEARARARLAETELERARQLVATGAATRGEAERANAEAEASRARAASLELAVSRLEHDRDVEASDRRARLTELQRRLIELDGDLEVEAARVRGLGSRAEQLRIRAPVAGRVGEVAAIEVGSVVEAGDRLGSVVPSSDLRVVAHFPAAALGRLRRGQEARLRLDGFAWTEFGRLHAEVSEVASEVRDDRIRVELRLRSPHPELIPLEHGLPGRAEIEVERVAPWTLVLRAVGRARDSTGPVAAHAAVR